MRISSYRFISILLKLHRCFVHGLKICIWFGYNPRIIFYSFLCKLNLVIFQALLLSAYVESMYLVRVTPPINFAFSDDSLFLKKFLAGDINSLNLLVASFVVGCCPRSPRDPLVPAGPCTRSSCQCPTGSY